MHACMHACMRTYMADCGKPPRQHKPLRGPCAPLCALCAPTASFPCAPLPGQPLCAHPAVAPGTRLVRPPLVQVRAQPCAPTALAALCAHRPPVPCRLRADSPPKPEQRHRAGPCAGLVRPSAVRPCAPLCAHLRSGLVRPVPGLALVRPCAPTRGSGPSPPLCAHSLAPLVRPRCPSLVRPRGGKNEAAQARIFLAIGQIDR